MVPISRVYGGGSEGFGGRQRSPGAKEEEQVLRAPSCGLFEILRRSSSQPRDWKSSWKDFSEVWGGSGGSFRKGA